jgi:hypothetical protein
MIKKHRSPGGQTVVIERKGGQPSRRAAARHAGCWRTRIYCPAQQWPRLVPDPGEGGGRETKRGGWVALVRHFSSLGEDAFLVTIFV